MASLYFLIVYDAVRDHADTRALGDDGTAAVDVYEAAEREYSGQPGISVVLVSADSLETVRALYGNYFGRAEIEGVREALART